MPDFKELYRGLRHAGRMLVGVPDYDNYVAHHQAHHPETPAMTYEEFFRNRQDSRYGCADGKIPRCC